MIQRPAVMNKGNMVYATTRSRDAYTDFLVRADNMRDDADRDERLRKCQCKTCHYIYGRMGGAAITERACMCCGKSVTYSNTCTDVLCLDCAKEHSLCKHCGGDIDLRFRRRNWPVCAADI